MRDFVLTSSFYIVCVIFISDITYAHRRHLYKATHFILSVVFISYFLANKILRGIICTRIIKHNIDYFMKEEGKTIFSSHNSWHKNLIIKVVKILLTFLQHSRVICFSLVQFLNKYFQSWHWKVEHKYLVKVLSHIFFYIFLSNYSLLSNSMVQYVTKITLT